MKIEKLYGFHEIRFFVLRADVYELTYILLQNNCINNAVTNGLKYKKEKKDAKQLYMEKQEMPLASSLCE